MDRLYSSGVKLQDALQYAMDTISNSYDVRKVSICSRHSAELLRMHVENYYQNSNYTPRQWSALKLERGQGEPFNTFFHLAGALKADREIDGLFQPAMSLAADLEEQDFVLRYGGYVANLGVPYLTKLRESDRDDDGGGGGGIYSQTRTFSSDYKHLNRQVLRMSDNPGPIDESKAPRKPPHADYEAWTVLLSRQWTTIASMLEAEQWTKRIITGDQHLRDDREGRPVYPMTSLVCYISNLTGHGAARIIHRIQKRALHSWGEQQSAPAREIRKAVQTEFICSTPRERSEIAGCGLSLSYFVSQGDSAAFQRRLECDYSNLVNDANSDIPLVYASLVPVLAEGVLDEVKMYCNEFEYVDDERGFQAALKPWEEIRLLFSKQ
ncbi:hypothetical protein QBC44DRAFT_356289 [Cladorrhinum sp. PSN332]|nr:hypothetical protein QBC44DRAFT_356289 [Cladorrhinum sp. PSN332]